MHAAQEVRGEVYKRYQQSVQEVEITGLEDQGELGYPIGEEQSLVQGEKKKGCCQGFERRGACFAWREKLPE